jgi:hypothetical protein
LELWIINETEVLHLNTKANDPRIIRFVCKQEFTLFMGKRAPLFKSPNEGEAIREKWARARNGKTLHSLKVG